MIEATCGCGWKWTLPESAPEATRICKQCGKSLRIACAESLPQGAGAGDFDAIFDILSGPQHVGERIFLGGVTELAIGKLENSPIHLPGKMVSRQHCRLTRVDFGPSKWSITDNQSTNGLVVNGRRVTFKELEDGNVVRVGEYELRFGHAEEELAPEVTVTPAARPKSRVKLIRDAALETVVPGTGISGSDFAPGCS